MLELMSLLAVMAGTGYVLRRFGIVRPELAADLSKVVLYFTLPPLVFLALHRAELAWSLLLMPAIAWGLAITGTGLLILLTKIVRVPGPTAGAIVVVTVFGNTTFLGYPIVQGFYGESGLTLAIFYDLLGAALAANTIAVVVASRLGGTGSAKGLQIVKRIVLFPTIWGLFLGILLRNLELPVFLEAVLESVGNLTGPLIMLSIGLSLRFSSWREELGWVALATAGRLLVLPLAIFLVLSALGLPPPMLRVAVLQAAMPTMFFSLTLALIFGLNKTLVVNTIMFSTILSFATLPIWRWLLGP